MTLTEDLGRSIRRVDELDAVRYQTPITEGDFDRLLAGHVGVIVRLKRYPPSLVLVLVGMERRVIPAEYEVRSVPLLIGPEAHHP